MEKSTKIIWNDKEEEVVMKSLVWGVIRKSLEKSFINDRLDKGLQRQHQILMTIVKSPEGFPTTIEGLDEVEYIEVGEPIDILFNELNTLKKKIN